jgi:hypothetical protein
MMAVRRPGSCKRYSKHTLLFSIQKKKVKKQYYSQIHVCLGTIVVAGHRPRSSSRCWCHGVMIVVDNGHPYLYLVKNIW